MAGGQQSLRVASLTMALTVVGGSLLGLVAGSVRGLDEILMRISDAFWISFFPGLFIGIAVLSANVPGDGLRDRYDPRRGE